MTRTVVVVGILWAALTALGEFLVINYDMYPGALSDKGDEIDHAFKVLLIMAVPVFMLVIAVLLAHLFSFSTGDLPPEDGPPLQGHGSVPMAWFLITGALTVVLMIYPGLTSLGKVFGTEPGSDLTVEVTGVQWTWLVSYPEWGVTNAHELALPVDRQVNFRFTSLDVLHSFWVPAFRMKADVVPGLTTHFSMVLTEEGDFESNPMMRVQCTELCGLSHSRMQIPVRVMNEEDFQAWLAENRKAEQPSPSAGAVTTLDLVAKDLLFDKESLEAPAGEPFDVVLDNQDSGVPHNFSIYGDESAATTIFQGDIIQGVDKITSNLPALDAGSYFFRCDVHPATMTGTLTVK